MPLDMHRIPVSSARSCVQNHEAIIYDRGGVQRIVALKDLTQIRWTRTLDGKSSASLLISGAACRRQTQRLAGIEPRRHELVISRGPDRVWEGPVRSVKFGRDSFELSAVDVLEYLNGRALTKYWPGPAGGGPKLMTARVQQILAHELATNYTAPGTTTSIPAWENITPPIRVLPNLDVRVGGIETTAETLPFEMTVLEHLQNLARGGLDFTTVGRRIVIWDSAKSIGEIRTFTEADISGDPNIFADGDKLVGVQHVIGQPEDKEPETSTKNVGSYVRPMDYYGPWADIHTRSEEGTASGSMQAALNTQARSISAGKNPVPVDLRIGSSASMRLDDTLTINDLVAGVDIPIVARLLGREMRQTQRIRSLEVSETKDGESVQASIGNSTSGGE